MRLRLNIRQLKVLIWVLCTGVLLYDGWTFYTIFQKKQSNQYLSRSRDHFNDVLLQDVRAAGGTDTETAISSSDEFDVLWKCLVNGEDPNPPKPVAEASQANLPPPEPELEELETVLEVSMIFYSTDALSRFAAIVYAEDNGITRGDGKIRRLHLSEGEPLREPYDEGPYFGKVLRIEEQSVVFQWGEEEVSVDPGLGYEGNGVKVADVVIDRPKDVLEGMDGPPARSLEVEPGVWVIGTIDRKELADDPSRLMDAVRVRTVVPKEQGNSSLELIEVDENSIVYKYGGRSGDRIISVNSIPMTSLSSAVSWFKQNDSLNSYDVLYERKGAVKNVVIHNP